jgi:hypothetical protein
MVVSIDGKGRAWSRATDVVDLADGMASINLEKRAGKADLATRPAMIARPLP